MKLARYKHSSPYSYTFGATITFELFKTHPELIKRVFLRPEIKHGEDLERILTQLKSKNIKIIESTKAFNILGAKDNCLLIAEFEKPISDIAKNENHVILVNPSDAGNLGTIMRTMAACSFFNLVLVGDVVDPFDPKTIRASMGAAFHLKIQHYNTFDEYLTGHGAERHNYAFMLDKNAKKLNEFKEVPSPYSLIFGNEAAGLPKDFAEKYNVETVIIPQSEFVDSLNLSVAASIALYDFKAIKIPR